MYKLWYGILYSSVRNLEQFIVLFFSDLEQSLPRPRLYGDWQIRNDGPRGKHMSSLELWAVWDAELLCESIYN
jgi:hypothetical protein